MSPHQRPEDAARELLTLRWGPEREAQIALGLVRRIRRRKQARAVGAASALVVAVALAVALQGEHALRSTDDASSAPTLLADGSRIEPLDPTTDLVLVERTAELTEVRLRAGRARFRVAKAPGRLFRVRVDGVRVEVLGTTFEVQRDGAAVRVRVDVGRVRVHDEGRVVELAAGESGAFGTPTAGDMAVHPTESGEQAVARDPTLPVEVDASEAAAPRKLRKGPRRAERAAEVSALLEVADTARLERRPSAAAKALLTIVKHHPSDPRAPQAAFMLGRIYQEDLGRPALAAREFGRARALGPGSPLAEDALARQVECLVQARELEAARELARLYDETYRRGVHGARLRKLVAP